MIDTSTCPNYKQLPTLFPPLSQSKEDIQEHYDRDNATFQVSLVVLKPPTGSYVYLYQPTFDPDVYATTAT